MLEVLEWFFGAPSRVGLLLDVFGLVMIFLLGDGSLSVSRLARSMGAGIMDTFLEVNETDAEPRRSSYPGRDDQTARPVLRARRVKLLGPYLGLVLMVIGFGLQIWGDAWTWTPWR